MAATATRSHVGAHVDSAAVREVSGRLLEEGRSRLDSAPESALVALRQAFSLEQQFGVDGERLCCVCASICHALSRLAHPHAPLAAVEPLVAGLDALEEMKARRDAGAPQVVVLDGHSEFLARELLGLARQLARPTTEGAVRAATLDELRAADKAYDALVAATRSAPLSLSPGTSLTVTQTELLYQHAGVARQIGTAVGAESGPRERDAATFHLRRAARKLALAQVPANDEQMISLHHQIAASEQARPTLPTFHPIAKRVPPSYHP